MHTSVKNVNASKSSKKSSTQTTISRFFTSANDKSQPTDQPGIKRLDGRHEGRGKVRALYAGQAQFVYTALLSYYIESYQQFKSNLHRMHEAFAVSKQHWLKSKPVLF